METSCCLGSEGNGDPMGGGGEGGPGPPKRGKDKQSMPSTGRDMEKDEEEQSNWMLWKRIGTNRVSSYLIKLNFYRHDCFFTWCNCSITKIQLVMRFLNQSLRGLGRSFIWNFIYSIGEIQENQS